MSNALSGSEAPPLQISRQIYPPLIGQEHAIRLLDGAIRRGRFGHAYLLSGPAGAGKATLAHRTAAVLCCAAPLAEPLTPCGVCPGCRYVAAGSHPDVMILEPGSGAAQEISIDQARALRKIAVLKPRLGGRYIFIVPHAEALNETASNALLKTIEEPGSSVVVLLAAPGESQVLPTIRSRCQIVRCGLVKPEEIASALVQRGAEPEAALDLARRSGGAPGTALRWLADPELAALHAEATDLFRQVLERHTARHARPWLAASSLRLAEQGRALGERWGEKEGGGLRSGIDRLLGAGLALFRDFVVLAAGGGENLLRHPHLQEAKQLASEIGAPALARMLHDIGESRRLLDRNVTPQLLLETLFWRLIAPGPLAAGLNR